MNVSKEDESIGYHYGKDFYCYSCGDCGAVGKTIRTGATILLVFLLGILVILGITGHDITIMIGDGSVVSNINDWSLSPRPSTFSANNNGDFGIGDGPMSLTPLLDHERNSTATAEETAILRALFDRYDGDGDGLWIYDDFSDFMEGILYTDESFAFLDSKTNDGYLDFDELVMIFTAFDTVPIFHTDPMNDIFESLADALNMSMDALDAMHPEVLATVVYADVEHGEEGISRDDWFEYFNDREWEQFNDDKDSYIDFPEFERHFFEDEMFLAVQECSHEEECANPQAAIAAFDKSEIVHLSRRRMLTKDYAKMWRDDAKRAEEKYKVEHPYQYKLDTMIGAIIPEPVEVHAPEAVREVIQPFQHQARVIAGEVREPRIWAALALLFAFLIAAGLLVHYYRDGCYDERSVVSVMRNDLSSQMVPIKDVAVGDFVYDGNGFTKIYYLQRYPENHMANMLEIRYGIPSDEQSITVTPAHLLYREAAPLPVRSDEVMIGDVLWGFTEYSYGDGFNFTVYDISTVRRIPANPITMSGDMMVNGIKTSVFTHSVELRDSMQSAGALFRWTSSINEALTQSVCESLITAYKGTGLRAQDMHSFITNNEAVFEAVYMSVPLVIAMAVFKAANQLFVGRFTKKQI